MRITEARTTDQGANEVCIELGAGMIGKYITAWNAGGAFVSAAIQEYRDIASEEVRAVLTDHRLNPMLFEDLSDNYDLSFHLPTGPEDPFWVGVNPFYFVRPEAYDGDISPEMKAVGAGVIEFFESLKLLRFEPEEFRLVTVGGVNVLVTPEEWKEFLEQLYTTGYHAVGAAFYEGLAHRLGSVLSLLHSGDGVMGADVLKMMIKGFGKRANNLAGRKPAGSGTELSEAYFEEGHIGGASNEE